MKSKNTHWEINVKATRDLDKKSMEGKWEKHTDLVGLKENKRNGNMTIGNYFWVIVSFFYMSISYGLPGIRRNIVLSSVPLSLGK